MERAAVAGWLGSHGGPCRAGVAATVVFSSLSLASNFAGGMATEKKRAELAMELDSERQRKRQMAELYDVSARYRGPLLESAIDLEQMLWHLLTDPGWRRIQPAGASASSNGSSGSPADAGVGASPWAQDEPDTCSSDICYLLFTLAQFLGFLEVLRREGPRERAFLQTGNPHGSDTLSTLVEGIRFVLCASQSSLERWYLQGRDRPHPGSRARGSREDIIQECIALQSAAPGSDGCAGPAQAVSDGPEEAQAPFDRMRVSRGTQRAIGTFMITTPMGATRHYTLPYGDFHKRMEDDPSFRRWFKRVETDALDLARSPGWAGQAPFPTGQWTRVLLLQQLLVEVMDLLDPDCIRVPLSRRTRLMPLKWGLLPGVELYQAQLKALSQAFDVLQDREGPVPVEAQPPLEGIRDLLRSFSAEDGGAAADTVPGANGAGKAQEGEAAAGARRSGEL